jgi:hypothetical protein
MAITILAIVFIILLGLVTVAGYRAVIRGTGGPARGEEQEKCTVCRRAMAKSSMVERQIGDYRILWFCRECITRLASDIGIRN